MSEYQCQLVDGTGEHHEVQLVRYEGAKIDEQGARWWADVHCSDPMPTLTEGMGVTIIHEGRGFEASILSVEDGNLGARIVFEVDPPWPVPAGP